MKKIVMMTAVALLGAAASATTYTGLLSTNGGEPVEAIATVTEQSGRYTISLGEAAIENVPAATTGSVTVMFAHREGVKVSARLNSANGALVIDMATAGQSMRFSNADTKFQMPNSDFETWTSATPEPRYWHSFKSASGGLAAFAPGKIDSSAEVRPGSKGRNSVVISSGMVFGVVGNGTLTSGRLNAGSTQAANPANHAETYASNSTTQTDKNGDLFVTPMWAAPDSLTLWLKFKQGTPQETYKYATLNAVLTDATAYQDPEDKAYTNVAAKAANRQIAACEWSKLSLPFDYATYAANSAEVKAILLTASTNAVPGKGSKGDKVWLDDLALVYNTPSVTDIKLNGSTLDGFNPAIDEYAIDGYEGEAPTASNFQVTTANAVGAVVGIIVEATDMGYVASINALSGDLATAKTYVVTLNKKSPAINGDLNQDGIVDETDVTALVNKILGSETSLQDSLCDLNGDGAIDVADLTELINIILNPSK